MLRSSLCKKSDLDSPNFRRWLSEMRETFRYHRKEWEYGYIAQALFERGKLQPGMKGLGFAVGREPLPALFASYGCEIVATDLDSSADPVTQSLWVATGQHASDVRHLNERGICPDADFEKRVQFRPADMNEVPKDFRDFDFVWSSCAIEHVGSLELSAKAVQSMMNCLKPGGIAIHTTEFNVSSNRKTYEVGESVIWRRRDLARLVGHLEQAGHRVEPFDFRMGSSREDRHVDEVPYPQEIHLKLRLGEYVATSLGIIIEANAIQSKRNWWSRILQRRAG